MRVVRVNYVGELEVWGSSSDKIRKLYSLNTCEKKMEKLDEYRSIR